jgi:hypothetical protein
VSTQNLRQDDLLRENPFEGMPNDFQRRMMRPFEVSDLGKFLNMQPRAAQIFAGQLIHRGIGEKIKKYARFSYKELQRAQDIRNGKEKIDFAITKEDC